MFKRNKRNTRNKRSPTVGMVASNMWDWVMQEQNYIPLYKNPEIIAGVNKIADLVASMSIYLMKETENGNIRVNDNLAKFVDIHPCKTMTRQNFIKFIVKTLLLDGEGNCIVMPQTKNGLFEQLIPIPPSRANIVGDGISYKINIGGIERNPDDLLHFVINPDVDEPYRGTGLRTSLKQIIDNLTQARNIENSYLNNPVPPVIIKIDALTGMDEEGNDKTDELADKYFRNTESGKPWIIPTELFEVNTVKPQSLRELAVLDSAKLSKETVAAILGVPAFVLGVGKFQKNEYDNFVNTKIKDIATAIEQELTRKLLYSNDLFFRFNIKKLFSFDFNTTAKTMSSLYSRGIVTGNEVRDSLGMAPLDGLDELTILENYIMLGDIGKQQKLVQDKKKEGDEDDDEEDVDDE